MTVNTIITANPPAIKAMTGITGDFLSSCAACCIFLVYYYAVTGYNQGADPAHGANSALIFILAPAILHNV